MRDGAGSSTNLQRTLIEMLRGTFEVERVGDEELLVRPPGRPPIRVDASEADLADFVAANAADGLLALGDVGDDSSGVTAALALLSVHIEESIETSGGGSTPSLIVRGSGLISPS